MSVKSTVENLKLLIWLIEWYLKKFIVGKIKTNPSTTIKRNIDLCLIFSVNKEKTVKYVANNIYRPTCPVKGLNIINTKRNKKIIQKYNVLFFISNNCLLKQKANIIKEPTGTYLRTFKPKSTNEFTDAVLYPLSRGVILPTKKRKAKEIKLIKRSKATFLFVNTILFLASDDAKFITGEIIKVDNGFSLNHDLSFSKID